MGRGKRRCGSGGASAILLAERFEAERAEDNALTLNPRPRKRRIVNPEAALTAAELAKTFFSRSEDTLYDIEIFLSRAPLHSDLAELRDELEQLLPRLVSVRAEIEAAPYVEAKWSTGPKLGFIFSLFNQFLDKARKGEGDIVRFQSECTHYNSGSNSFSSVRHAYEREQAEREAKQLSDAELAAELARLNALEAAGQHPLQQVGSFRFSGWRWQTALRDELERNRPYRRRQAARDQVAREAAAAAGQG